MCAADCLGAWKMIERGEMMDDFLNDQMAVFYFGSDGRV